MRLFDFVSDLSFVTHASANFARDYTQEYPEDEYGQEMGKDARVWRVYNDETDRSDAEMVNGWKGTLDTLLIFVSGPLYLTERHV